MLATALVIVWSSYVAPYTFLLATILALIAAGLVLYGRRMKSDVKLPKMPLALGIVIIVIWAFSILTFLKINRDMARYTGAAGNLGPIFPITLGAAFCTFAYVAYVTRSGGALASLGNGFLAFCAGPMVFELPFVLIVIPGVQAPLVPALIFLTPLFTIIFTTLALLLFSRRVALTKYSVYLYAAMLFVFAIWALEGYSYPSNPTAFALNAASKVLGFASVAAMFRARPLSSSKQKQGEEKSLSSDSALPKSS